MIVKGEEAARSITSVFRLAMFDRRAAAGFGRDMAACRRSFWAYVFALPALVLLILLKVLETDGADATVASLAYALADIIEIAGFPLILLSVLRAFGRSNRWAWFVTSYNWFSAVQSVCFVAVIGISSGALGEAFESGFQIYLLVLEAFLADAVLEIGGVRALLIVLLDVFFGLGIDYIARQIATGTLGS